MDLIGPLSVTNSGNKYIVIFADYLTRYPETIPIRDATAATVALALLENIVFRYGSPLELLTDRGSTFTSELFREVCSPAGDRAFVRRSAPSGF